MQIYLGSSGSPEGPFTLYQVQEQLRSGDIDGDTLGWTQGEDTWKPLREIPAVLGLIQHEEKRKLDAELAEMQRPSLAPESSIPPSRLPSHAFARFVARSIDLLLFQAIIISFVWPLPEMPDEFKDPQKYIASLPQPTQFEDIAPMWNFLKELYLHQIKVTVAWLLVETFLLTATGYTLGKWLFRIRVLGPDGKLPGFFRSIYRSILLGITGIGLGIQPLRYIMEFIAFIRLQSKGSTWWDDQAHTEVQQLAMSRGRFLMILALFLIVIFIEYKARSGS